MDVNKKSWAEALTVIDEIESGSSVDEIFQTCQDYILHVGGTSLLIGRLVNPIITGKKISAFGKADWPEEWAKKWIAEDYVIHDPISQYALKSRTTFDWQTAWNHGSDYGRKILDQGRDFNLKKGVAIPVTVGHLPLGIVSVGYEEELSPGTLSRLEIVAIHSYSRMLNFIDDKNLMPLLHLTKREIDVLTFTAAGKTSWEISKIYGIGESTVKTHLRNIIIKANAANKTHAVSLALREGQILP